MTEPKRDRLRELDEQGEFPDRWDPAERESLTGKVRRYSDVELEKSGLTRLVVIEKENGEVTTVFLSPTVLKGEFWRLRPKIGERVFIRYLGTPEGKGYKKFVVRCLDRDTEADPDWGDEPGDVGTPTTPFAPPKPAPPPDPDDPFADELASGYARQTVR